MTIFLAIESEWWHIIHTNAYIFILSLMLLKIKLFLVVVTFELRFQLAFVIGVLAQTVGMHVSLVALLEEFFVQHRVIEFVIYRALLRKRFFVYLTRFSTVILKHLLSRFRLWTIASRYISKLTLRQNRAFVLIPHLSIKISQDDCFLQYLSLVLLKIFLIVNSTAQSWTGIKRGNLS